MKFVKGNIQGLVTVIPTVHRDPRGYFFEAYHHEHFSRSGLTMDFVQDNQSFSSKGTLRGLHYQINQAQDKLVRVLSGEIFDVAVDIRLGSPTFGQWESIVLSAENQKQFLIPKGFAHGFQVLSDTAEILYKCSDYYAPQHERGILWSDPEIDIDWPIDNPLLSSRDEKHPLLSEHPEENFFIFNTSMS
ncbi:MAG: dTDP-4-dehydrorhamnose 3,5-epimerase [Acidobacteria bacterium]|nr:MAG: dTDP-4-dehydrorhamnose 3,5-epimerase [Acidobacteriota bacterium]